MDNLPDEILERIFHFMDALELVKGARVCRRWNRLLEHENSKIWAARFKDCGDSSFRTSPLIRELSTFRSKVLAYECAWSDSDHSENVYLKGDSLTFHRKPVAQSTDAIRSKHGFLRGVHYYIVTFHGPKFGSAALVGVCSKNMEMQVKGYVPLLGESPHAWAWDISKQVLRHNSQEVALVKQEVAIKQKIGMTLDMEEGTLEFDVEGEDIGVRFTNISLDQPLYPAVSAVFGNSEISMVYVGKPIVG